MNDAKFVGVCLETRPSPPGELGRCWDRLFAGAPVTLEDLLAISDEDLLALAHAARYPIEAGELAVFSQKLAVATALLMRVVFARHSA